jgi:hypothetical protein
MVVGSPLYMAPEQARGSQDIDERVDVWGVSAVLYECLAGAPPFSGSCYEDLLVSIVTDEFEPLALEEDASELARIVEKGLEKDVDLRWQSTEALGTALARWLLSQGVERERVTSCLHEIEITGMGADTSPFAALREQQTARPPPIPALQVLFRLQQRLRKPRTRVMVLTGLLSILVIAMAATTALSDPVHRALVTRPDTGRNAGELARRPTASPADQSLADTNAMTSNAESSRQQRFRETDLPVVSASEGQGVVSHRLREPASRSQPVAPTASRLAPRSNQLDAGKASNRSLPSDPVWGF